MDKLTAADKKSDKKEEIELIRTVCQDGGMKTIKPTRIDIYLESNRGEIYLFNIKTAKPNRGAFKEFKRTLLEWTATVLSENPKANIKPFLTTSKFT